MLVEEGLVSRIDLEKILSEKQGYSAPQAMLDMQLIDEDQFTEVWCRFSGLKSQIVIPEDIAAGQISHWSESQALRYHAMPAPAGDDGVAVFGFVEPPNEENLRSVAESFGSPVVARLLPPSNFTALRHFIYPRSVLDGQPVNPLAREFEALSDKDRRRVRELQMTRRRSLADAMIQLNLARPDDVRKKYANALNATPTDFSKLTISVAMLKSLGALFCEVHGLLPLNNASIGICNPVHPAVSDRIKEILGPNIPFSTDTPPAFMKMWNDMLALKFSEAEVLEFFIDQGSLIQEHATRVREMQRLISGPVDRLLIQLGLVSKQQMQQALRQTTGLELASTAEPPFGLEAEELLAPGFGRQSGLAVHQIRDTGITFRLIGLPIREEIREVMERCSGMPLKFELDPILK